MLAAGWLSNCNTRTAANCIRCVVTWYEATKPAFMLLASVAVCSLLVGTLPCRLLCRLLLQHVAMKGRQHKI